MPTPGVMRMPEGVVVPPLPLLRVAATAAPAPAAAMTPIMIASVDPAIAAPAKTLTAAICAATDWPLTDADTLILNLPGTEFGV